MHMLNKMSPKMSALILSVVALAVTYGLIGAIFFTK